MLADVLILVVHHSHEPLHGGETHLNERLGSHILKLLVSELCHQWIEHPLVLDFAKHLNDEGFDLVLAKRLDQWFDGQRPDLRQGILGRFTDVPLGIAQGRDEWPNGALIGHLAECDGSVFAAEPVLVL